MTDPTINRQHFGSDPADIRIRIRISPEIRIRIPDLLWLRFLVLAEICGGGLRALSTVYI